jgi:hypothetical protein
MVSIYRWHHRDARRLFVGEERESENFEKNERAILT